MDPNAKPNRQPSAQSDDEIAVKELRFCAGYRNPDLPFEESKTLGTLTSKDRIAITYLPRKRFYRIVEKARHDQAKDIVFYVPESWALWVPVEASS